MANRGFCISRSWKTNKWGSILNKIALTSSTYVIWTERKESLGIRGFRIVPEFAEILLVDDLREPWT
jgi:hypothetical protein